MSTKRFNDTWTRQARALGYPSRAVFKLIEANKKFKFIKTGQRVLDLGCAPGSWSKLASRVVGPKGFVLGLDMTQLSHAELHSMGAVEGMEIYDPESKESAKKQYSKGLRRPAHPDYEPDFDYDLDLSDLSANSLTSTMSKSSSASNGLDSDNEATFSDFDESVFSDLSDTEAMSLVDGDRDLSPEELEKINRDYNEKKNSYYAGKRGRERTHVALLPDMDKDGVLERAHVSRGEATTAATQNLLKAEQAIRRARSPVRFIQADVTEWVPEPHLQRYFDVIVSDMAPKTTGVPSHDAQLSVELCHSVLDLAAVVLKTPSTKRVQVNDVLGGTIPGVRSGDIVVSPSSLDRRTNKMTLSELFEAYKSGSLRGRELVDAELLCGALGDNGDAFATPSHHVDHKTINKLLRKYKPTQRPVEKAEETYSILSRSLGSPGPAYIGSFASEFSPQYEEVDVYHGSVLMKCFQGDDFDSLLQRMKSLFVTVKSIKPASSRSESVEIFLYGKGFKGMKHMQAHEMRNAALASSLSKPKSDIQTPSVNPDQVSSLSSNSISPGVDFDVAFRGVPMAGGLNNTTRMDRDAKIERAALAIDRENRAKQLRENPSYASELIERYKRNVELASTSPESVYFDGETSSGSIVSEDAFATSPRKALRMNSKEAQKQDEARATFELGVYEEDEEVTSTRAKTEKGKAKAAKTELEKALRILTQTPVPVEAFREAFPKYASEGLEFSYRAARMRDNSAINLVAEFVPQDPYNGLTVDSNQTIMDESGLLVENEESEDEEKNIENQGMKAEEPTNVPRKATMSRSRSARPRL